MEYLSLFAFLAGPGLASFFIACITSVVLGKKLYIQSGRRVLASIFAVSLFLVLFYTASKVISISVNSLFFSSPESGDILGILGLVFGVYIYYMFGWFLRLVGILLPVILIYRTKRDTPSVSTLPSRNPLLLKITPLVVVLALWTLATPLLSLYGLYQVKQEDKRTLIIVNQNQQEYDRAIGPRIKEDLSSVQSAIAAFQRDTGKLPGGLQELVPKYLTSIPELPADTVVRGNYYTYDYEVVDQLRNYYTVCAIVSNFEEGLSGRVCIDQTGQSSSAH